MKAISRHLWLSLGLVVMAFGAHAQTITGTVYDEFGKPMPGVTVRVDGTSIGDASNLEGKYTIRNAPVGQQNVIFTFIGYKQEGKPVNVPPTGEVALNHKMEVDQAMLDEFVVVGYGVQRKREVTGSISQLKPKDFTDIPAPSFEAALQGKAAGVQVTQGSGLAGSGSVVRIRGIASISAGGDPLYVVDGIPITQDYFLNGNRGGMNNNPLATINPNDIESIEILKDAAATGIYGSRGANGVILITTKRSKSKEVKFDFMTRHGVSVPTARPNMLNSAQYLQLYQEAWENDGGVGLAPLPGGISWANARNTDTDWVDETVGLGFKQAYNLGVSKGWDKVNSYFSIGYDDNGSYLIGNSYERTSFRSNVDWKVTNKLTASFGASLSRGVNNRVAAAWDGGLGAAMSTALPIFPVRFEEDVFDADGNLLHAAGDPWNRGTNPVRQREGTDWRTQEWRALTNMRLEYKVSDKFVLSASAAYDHMDLRDDIYTDPELRRLDRTQTGVFGRAERFPTWVDNWNTNVTATYFHDLNEDHRFTYLVGMEYQNSETRGRNIIFREDSLVDGPFHRSRDLLNQPFIEDEQIGFIDGGPRVPVLRNNFLSAFARVNYDYKGKLFAQASFRMDGSSKFGENNRFGFFPSVSAGYVLSQEDFIKNLGVFSFLKVRTGIGLVGNAAIPDYQQYGFYNLIDFSYNNQPIRFLAQPPNPNLRWESASIFDAAVEMGFLDDRITSTVSFYRKNTTDVLLNVVPQNSTGLERIWDNLGEILNWGVEFELGVTVIDREQFRWRTDFNAAYNYNEIRSIGNYSPDAVSGGTNDTRVVVGKPVGTNFLVRFSHVDPESGRPVYLDINGNPTFDWNIDDRVAVGRVLPIAIGGWTNTFTYKRWEVGMVIVYSLGSNIYDSSSKRQMGVVTDWNMRSEIFDRWRQPGDTDVQFPRLTRNTQTHGAGTPWINTDMWLDNGDYARLRRLSITYNIPSFNMGSLRIDRAQITVSAMNLFTVTNFGGLDPEIARDFEDVNDRNMSPNISFLTPPQERAYTLQLNLNF